jgi:hypothetical protein
MDALHQHMRNAALGAGLLLACLVVAPALAQQSVPTQAQGASAASAETTVRAEHTAIPATRAPARKRSGFGAAMAELTQALREASQQQAASPPPAAAPAADAPAQPAMGDGALAVESPP